MIKIYNKPRKIRMIANQNTTSPTLGVVLPPEFKSWTGIFVTVKESGDKIILQSGCIPKALQKGHLRSISQKLEVVQI